MQPKTKQQKEIFKLSDKLKSITSKQKDWAYNKLFKNIAEPYRSSVLCMECGHVYKSTSGYSIPKITECPSCNRVLKYVSKRSNVHSSQSLYFAQITTVEQFQVVRIFEYNKHFHRTHPSHAYCHEVVQVWINQNGKYDLMTKITASNSWYSGQGFSNNSNLEIRNRNSNTSYYKLRIVPEAILQGRKVLPIVKRNGYTGSFFGRTPQLFFLDLLQDSFFETLVKNNHAALIGIYGQHSKGIKKYWQQLKIAFRNNYEIDDFGIYEDYLDLLEHFGKDLYSPKYLCPENFKKVHDKLVRKKREADRGLELEERLKRIIEDQKIYHAEKNQFFGLLFKSRNLQVKPLITVEEFVKEGDALNHCLYANQYHKRQDSLILSARINDVPIETIEISLKELSIKQARGKHNTQTKYHDKIVELVNSGMPQIARIVNKKQVV